MVYRSCVCRGSLVGERGTSTRFPAPVIDLAVCHLLHRRRLCNEAIGTLQSLSPTLCRAVSGFRRIVGDGTDIAASFQQFVNPRASAVAKRVLPRTMASGRPKRHVTVPKKFAIEEGHTSARTEQRSDSECWCVRNRVYLTRFARTHRTATRPALPEQRRLDANASRSNGRQAFFGRVEGRVCSFASGLCSMARRQSLVRGCHPKGRYVTSRRQLTSSLL